MDIKVLQAQSWLNDTYAGKSWYTPIDEDGITGQGTCRALCKALQYEIGLSDIDGIIGSGTLNACPTVGTTTTNENLVKIVQCGFYCKGYECGDISGEYDASTQTAAKNFRSDAGFPNTNGNMPPLFIMALLNTDAFVLISGGKTYVREAQQYLNSNYFIHFETWGLIPCNGVPDRNMMKGIIAALQYEEANHSMSGVDGIYGDNTLAGAPTLSTGTSRSAYVKIVQMCLMCMMEVNPGLDGVYDSSLASLISDFQEFYCLSTATAGVVSRVTWASLLSSKGDTTRPALACDTSYQLTSAMANALYTSGYRYIGRYLTGTVGSGSTLRNKNLTISELNYLFNAGLHVFAIFQEGAVTREKFTFTQGRADASTAMEAARSLGIPYGEIIYFAIDYDMTDEDVTNYVIPYFQGVRKTVNSNYNRYRIGIYASRNVCTRVANAGYSVSSFVSDMSTGFSGNLGYKIPENWAFDQFWEYTYTSSGLSFGLDKVAYSGRYSGFNYREPHVDDEPIPVPTEDILSDRYRELIRALTLVSPINPPLNQTIVLVNSPILYAVAKSGHNVNFSKSSNYEWTGELTISNGSLDSTAISQAAEIANGLSNQFAINFISDGGVTLSTGLCNELSNGSIDIGFGVSPAGFLMVVYSIEQVLWTTADMIEHTLSVEVTLEFRNCPTTTLIKHSVATACVALPAGAVTILAISYLPAFLPTVGTYPSAIMALLTELAT